jgi:nitrite reductase/ring-hydroxylating ferredoxin subunit
VRGYVNACPHRGTPLEMFPDRFLDETRRQLVCSTHGARFRVEDGFCTLGPCRGSGLDPVAVEVRGDEVWLAAS